MPLESFLNNFRGAYFVKKKLEILNYMYEETNNNIWSKILKITITVLTALATAFGIQACCG